MDMDMSTLRWILMLTIQAVRLCLCMTDQEKLGLWIWEGVCQTRSWISIGAVGLWRF